MKISTLNEFKDALKKEEYKINEVNEENFKEEITLIFEVDKTVIEILYIYVLQIMIPRIELMILEIL